LGNKNLVFYVFRARHIDGSRFLLGQS